MEYSTLYLEEFPDFELDDAVLLSLLEEENL